MIDGPPNPAPARHLRAALLVAGCLVSAGLGGCRCNEETLAPVVFDANDDRPAIDPTQVLAPPWTPPQVSLLDNGGLMHWLHEPGSLAFHMRVLLPTSIHGEKLSAAGTAIALEALEIRLTARLRRIGGATFDLRSRPGRVEIVVHGRDRDAERLITALGDSLADAGSSKLLALAQGKVLARQGRAEPVSLAAAGLISSLFEQPLGREFTSKQDLVDLGRSRLERGWSTLTDPRDAVVLVHAGRSPEDEDLSAALAHMGKRWKPPLLSFGSGKRSVTARLRPPTDESPREDPRATWLLTESSPAPMIVLPGELGKGGRAEVILGRVIPTPTVEDRTLARLCQRLIQEELDARLIVAGPVSIFAIRVRVSPSDPVHSLERIIERTQAFSERDQLPDRLEQAARLWLGARVVEASLSGEDWTSLWSDSVDLAGEDREIFTALATDAQGMLALDSDQVRSFLDTWFDPRGGEPGWTWVAVGLNDSYRTKLGTKIKLIDLD